jgi:hypothetical protein
VNVVPGDRVLIPEASQHESQQHDSVALDGKNANHPYLCSLVEVA